MYSFYLGSLIRAVGDDRLDADDPLRDIGAFFEQLLAGIGEPAPRGSARLWQQGGH